MDMSLHTFCAWLLENPSLESLGTCIYNGSCWCFLLVVVAAIFLGAYLARRNGPSKDSEFVRYLEDHPS